MKKIKQHGTRRVPTQGNQEGQERPFGERAVPSRDLEMALAAGKARQAIDDYAEDLEGTELAMLTVAYEFFKTYFGERSVRFDTAGAPLLPVGSCGDVDLERLLESASIEAMAFLDELSEKVEMYFEHERDHFVELGRRHGFLFTRGVGNESTRWLVPVVVTVDLHDGAIYASDGINRIPLPAPPALVAQQKPQIWERWTKLRASEV